MAGIFETVFSSRQGLGDIGVVVDPFTGKTSVHIPTVARYPGPPLLNMGRFLDSVQQQMLAGEVPPKIDSRLNTLNDIFNSGIAQYRGQYVLMVRFQNTKRFNDLYLAWSDDGLRWKHVPKVLDLPDLPPSPRADTLRAACPDMPKNQKWHKGVFYDPRITQMETGEYFITLAVDYDTVEEKGKPYVNICDNVLYRTRDFKKFEFISTFAGNTRNGVLFPRKLNGWYYMACRPNYSLQTAGGEVISQRQSTVLMRSKDLVNWEEPVVLFTAGHAWICFGGPGFPPFETEKYWVLGAHGVEVHGTMRQHYRGGVCLIDKKTMRLAAGPVPILDPQEQFELDGTVANVIFPTGLLFSDGRGYGIKRPETKIAMYYGGADRVIHVGLSTVGRLVDTALNKYNGFAVHG